MKIKHFIKLLIVSLIVFYVPLAYAETTDSNLSTLNVGGRGEVKAKPDIAYLSFAVTRKGKTASEAASLNASAAQKLIDTLLRSGIAEKDLQTTNISISPVYKRDQPNDYNDYKVIGYEANNSIRATIRKISDVGKIIDIVVFTGDYTVGGVNFDIDNDDNFEAEALKSAVSDAKRKADIVASAAGKTITGIQTITVGSVGGERFYGGYAAASADISTPVQPGELTVSSSVTIDYILSK